jgi:L-asparagine transporter-like permease
MTMVKLNAQNVHVTVTLVTILLLVTSVLVSEFKPQNVFVQKDGTLQKVL